MLTKFIGILGRRSHEYAPCTIKGKDQAGEGVSELQSNLCKDAVRLKRVIKP